MPDGTDGMDAEDGRILEEAASCGDNLLTQASRSDILTQNIGRDSTMARMATVSFFGLLLMVGLGCESVEESMSLRKPTARLMGVQFREANVYGATVVFDVQIVNHYPAELPLLRFRYALSSRGEGFMAGASELAMKIPVGGSGTVSLPARIDYLSTLRRLGGVRPGATIPYEAQLDLTINTPRLGAIMLPLSKAGEIRLPELPDADLDKLLGTNQSM